MNRKDFLSLAGMGAIGFSLSPYLKYIKLKNVIAVFCIGDGVPLVINDHCLKNNIGCDYLNTYHKGALPKGGSHITFGRLITEYEDFTEEMNWYHISEPLKTHMMQWWKDGIVSNFPTFKHSGIPLGLTEKLFESPISVETAKKVTIESKDFFLEWLEILHKRYSVTDLILVSGFGGGTGSGATPIIAEYAQQINLRVHGIVSTPFSWEGSMRNKTAMQSIIELKNHTDELIIHNNNDAIKGYESIKVSKAFEKSNDVFLENLKKCIRDIIT